MTTVTIVDPSTGNEIDVSDKAFETIYRDKGFRLKPRPAAAHSESPTNNEASADGDQVLGKTGEQAVPTGSVSTGPAGSSDTSSVRSRKGRKGSGPART